MRWIKKKNYTFGFNLSFGFFPQCSLHIHASYSISQKLNVPMAPLSEPNAVGIVIAHGKQPSLTSVGRISWEHWSSVIALNPVRKPPSVAFTTLCRISCKITILWEKKKWYCGFFMDSYQRAATWPLPLPNCCGLFFIFQEAWWEIIRINSFRILLVTVNPLCFTADVCWWDGGLCCR